MATLNNNLPYVSFYQTKDDITNDTPNIKEFENLFKASAYAEMIYYKLKCPLIRVFDSKKNLYEEFEM